MEEERVKSSLELAMERISALPELTPQEIAAQREKELTPLGTAIAVKYLNGALAGDDLPAEVDRYDGERRRMVRRALLEALCGELRFGKTPRDARKALRGAAAVAPRRRQSCEDAARRFEQYIGEFESARDRRHGEFAALASGGMRELGISGSAVRPNLEENEEWKRSVDEIRREFEPKLEELRRELLRSLEAE